MSYEDLQQSVMRGMIGSTVIIFLGVSHDGWGQSLGCASQIWKLFRGWALLAVIIGVANYLAILWADNNVGGDGFFGIDNDDDNDPDDNSTPKRRSGGRDQSGNPPAQPGGASGGGNPPGKPPSQPKNPAGGGNPPKTPTPQPRQPSPCPSPQQPTGRRRRSRTPEPEEPKEDVCMVCGYVHPGGSHQW